MTVMRTTGLAPVLPAEATVTETAKEYVVSLAVPGRCSSHSSSRVSSERIRASRKRWQP